MEFLLPRYLKQRRRPEPESGIACPEELLRTASANGLWVGDSITDGSCGLDAFSQCLQAAHQRKLVVSGAVKLGEEEGFPYKIKVLRFPPIGS